MGTMKDHVDVGLPKLGADGGLRQGQIRAIAGASKALVALHEAGRENLVWVEAICTLTTGSVGRFGILAVVPAATTYILLGLLDTRDEAEASRQTGPVAPSDLGSPAAVDAKSAPSFFSTEGDILRIQHGEASLELHKNGTIIFRGSYIASYSSGANRIRGTTIELN